MPVRARTECNPKGACPRSDAQDGFCDAACAERPAAGERDILRGAGPIGGRGLVSTRTPGRRAASQRTQST